MIKNMPWTRGSIPSTTCGLCSDTVTPVPGRHTITHGSSEALHSCARQTHHHTWQLRGPSLRCLADTPSRVAAQRPFTLVPGRHTITSGSSEALHSGAWQTHHHEWQLRGPSLLCPADTPSCVAAQRPFTPVPGRHSIMRGSSEALHSGARQTHHHAWQLRGPSLLSLLLSVASPPTPLRKDKSILTDAQTWTLRIALISVWLTPHARSLHSLSAVLSKYIRDSPVPCCCCLVAKSRLPLCDPVGCSPPGFSVHGISQARILE